MKLPMFLGTGKNTTDVLDIFFDSSCTACYNLDGDVTDLSGNNDGTATNLTYTDGKFGQAGDFDGTGYVSVPTIDVNSDFSFSAWVKSDSRLDNNNYIYCVSGGSYDNFIIAIADTTGLPYVSKFDYSTSSLKKIEHTQSVDDELWHHICVVKTSGTSQLYVDRVAANGDLDVDTLISNGFIGTDNRELDGRKRPLIGQIDQVRIFTRALSQEEVRKLYLEIGR